MGGWTDREREDWVDGWRDSARGFLHGLEEVMMDEVNTGIGRRRGRMLSCSVGHGMVCLEAASTLFRILKVVGWRSVRLIIGEAYLNYAG